MKFTLIFATLISLSIPAYGQSLPTLDFTGRSDEKRPELLDNINRNPPPKLALPPPPPPAKESSEIPIKSVLVRRIVVTDSTVFTPDDISVVTAPYENRRLSMEEMESLRRDLTLMYVNRGYINSGAILPDQAVADGLLTFQVVEGTLSKIVVEGNRHFNANFLRKRIALGAGAPLNLLPLQERLQLLQQDQRVQSIHAELRPGAKPGESELKVQVQEKPPFSVWLAFNNYQSPSIGAERALITLTHQNLTGHGDILGLTYGYSEGLNPLLDAFYALPINAYDTTLFLRYRNNDAQVVDKVFGSLNIVSKSEGVELTLRQPVYRSLSQELALALTIEREDSRTSLSGEPFSFSPGMDNGHAVVIPLRFSQEWTYRTQKQVFAARSRMTFGLHTRDATIHQDQSVPDGQFFAWLGQFQWARILEFLDTQLIARADIQRSTDPLLPVEQMAIGGRYSVRGYRESLLVRDEVLIASLEARLPLIQNERWADYLQLASFYDYGRGTNVAIPTSGPTEISSVGAGLRWGSSLVQSPFQMRAETEIYWGYRLRNIAHTHEDLQDDGFHFQFAVTASF